MCVLGEREEREGRVRETPDSVSIMPVRSKSPKNFKNEKNEDCVFLDSISSVKQRKTNIGPT